MSGSWSASYRVEQFDDHHRRPGFSCGVDALDAYFYRRANRDRRKGVAMPYVLVEGATGSVAGYYTLSSFAIVPTDLSVEMAQRLPRRKVFPAILLGRLAVDRRHHGEGLGGALLIDALYRSFGSSQKIGIMAVVANVESDGAHSFYERYQFRPFDTHEHRLYLPMAEIARLEQISPSPPSGRRGRGMRG